MEQVILIAAIAAGMILTMFFFMFRTSPSEKYETARNMRFWESLFVDKKGLMWQKVQTDIGIEYRLHLAADTTLATKAQKAELLKKYGMLPHFVAIVEQEQSNECKIETRINSTRVPKTIYIGTADAKQVDSIITLAIIDLFEKSYKTPKL